MYHTKETRRIIHGPKRLLMRSLVSGPFIRSVPSGGRLGCEGAVPVAREWCGNEGVLSVPGCMSTMVETF